MNLFVKDSGYLPRLVALKEKVLSGSKCPREVAQKSVKPRPVPVLETVKHVLGSADKPMRAKEIQTTCEQLLAKPVSMPSIAHCLYRHSQGPNSLFVKVGRGLYEPRAELVPYGLQARRRKHPGNFTSPEPTKSS